MENPFRTELAGVIASGAYGLFGATVHYLYLIATKREPKFRLGIFLLNGLFGFYIGVVIGNFVPDSIDQSTRDGTIMVAGFLVYQVFDYVEERGIEKIKKRLGMDDDEDKRI